jgi:hypothetical protein
MKSWESIFKGFNLMICLLQPIQERLPERMSLYAVPGIVCQRHQAFSQRVQKNSPIVYLSGGRGMSVILSRAILLLEGQLLIRTENNMVRKFMKLTFGVEELLLK